MSDCRAYQEHDSDVLLVERIMPEDGFRGGGTARSEMGEYDRV